MLNSPKKLNLNEFTIYAMTTTFYQSKEFEISYNEFLQEIQDKMDKNRDKGFYETMLEM